MWYKESRWQIFSQKTPMTGEKRALSLPTPHLSHNHWCSKGRKTSVNARCTTRNCSLCLRLQRLPWSHREREDRTQSREVTGIFHKVKTTRRFVLRLKLTFQKQDQLFLTKCKRSKLGGDKKQRGQALNVKTTDFRVLLHEDSYYYPFQRM